jgi:hypothetical protein
MLGKQSTNEELHTQLSRLFLRNSICNILNCQYFCCQVCAANFGDICSVVGQQATEEMLVSIPGIIISGVMQEQATCYKITHEV